MTALFYLTEAPEYPPAFPAPQPTPSLEDKHSETSSAHVRANSDRIGQTFTTLCGFWIIVCEIVLVYHTPGGPRKVPIAFALSQYNKLLLLTASLCDSMKRRSNNPPHVLVFQ